MSKEIAVLLADGFEEIEAVVPIDFLRRLDFNVITASLNEKTVGAHNLSFDVDCNINDLDIPSLDAVILPGGLPGAENLRNSHIIISLIQQMNNAGKIIAAICAAPIVLAEAGIMTGKICTGYPMKLVKEALEDADYTGGKVERDGNVITGKGPGAAFDFSLEIATALGREADARQLLKLMFVR